MRINVDDKAIKSLTVNLRAINRTALPVAIRDTLNDAAFDDKKNSLHTSARRNFPGLKQPQFFKTFSRVNKATGYNINTMKSEIGMMDLGKPSARRAIENMDKQEIGGIVNDGFSYLKASRGGKENGKVRRENYYDKGKVISGRSKTKRGRGTKKSKFIARVFRAKKENKPMFFDSMRGNFLVKVKRVSKKGRDKVSIDFKLLMKDRATTPARIKGTHFAEEAAKMSQKKIPDFYLKNAEKQFKRALKK